MQFQQKPLEEPHVPLTVINSLCLPAGLGLGATGTKLTDILTPLVLIPPEFSKIQQFDCHCCIFDVLIARHPVHCGDFPHITPGQASPACHNIQIISPAPSQLPAHLVMAETWDNIQYSYQTFFLLTTSPPHHPNPPPPSTHSMVRTRRTPRCHQTINSLN